MVDTHAQKVWAERNAKSAARAEARLAKGDTHSQGVWKGHQERRLERVATLLPTLADKRRAPLPLGSHSFAGAPRTVAAGNRLDVIKNAASKRNKKKNRKH